VPGMIAVGSSTDESLRELSARAAIVVELGDRDAMSDEQGRFTIPDVTGTEIRLGALPADFAAGVYGGTAAQVPAGNGLPDIALVKLRVGRDETPGTFGITIAPPPAEVCTDSLAIAAVSGPAAAAGVRVGETITAMDGKDVTSWRCYLVGALLTAKPGTTIAITLGNGETVALTAIAGP
jgi:membrane-associated protease RseP (regulator of RpoE activity)